MPNKSKPKNPPVSKGKKPTIVVVVSQKPVKGKGKGGMC
jgi:hypothetical protein